MKMTNAQKNAAYPVTANYKAWQKACEAAMPGCKFTAQSANHRFATPANPKDYEHGHFWLNTDHGAVFDDDGNITFSTRKAQP